MNDSHRTGYVKTIRRGHFYLVPDDNYNQFCFAFWQHQGSGVIQYHHDSHLLLSSAKSNFRRASPIWWVVITCGSPASRRDLTSGARVALNLENQNKTFLRSPLVNLW